MVTAEMLEGIVSTVTTNVSTIVPIGVTILGLVAGVGLIPKILYKFL